jgi:hypothetical protein
MSVRNERMSVRPAQVITTAVSAIATMPIRLILKNQQPCGRDRNVWADLMTQIIVPGGTFWISNSGLIPPPSQVNFFGSNPLSLNEGLVKIIFDRLHNYGFRIADFNS